MQKPKQIVQAVLFVVFFAVFLKSGSPLVVLVLFLLLCGHSLNLFFYSYNREPAGGKDAEIQSWPQVLTAMFLQLVSLVVLGLIVWLFITRKLQVFDDLRMNAG